MLRNTPNNSHRATPKAADREAGWPRLLGECEGLRVKLKRAVNTGMMSIPAGVEGVLETSGNGWHLLQFRGDPCSCCGVSARVSRMSWTDFEVIV